MENQAVVSSNISTVGYDEGTLTLEIEFKSGGIYQYHGVSKEVHDKLMDAPSIGKHFSSEIKDNYKFTKVR